MAVAEQRVYHWLSESHFLPGERDKILANRQMKQQEAMREFEGRHRRLSPAALAGYFQQTATTDWPRIFDTICESERKIGIKTLHYIAGVCRGRKHNLSSFEDRQTINDILNRVEEMIGRRQSEVS